MQFICVVTASYTLGFLMTKNSWLVFQMKHKVSKQTFCIFTYGKMFIIQFHSMEKNFVIHFHSLGKKAYHAIFMQF